MTGMERQSTIGDRDSKSQPLDQAARDLISFEGLDQTLFVEAGAGTGKTTQLVERIVNLVLAKGLRLADVAAITFTEAAASELKARVRVAFETRAIDLETSDKARVACVQAIEDADLAAISTVHGFARRILSEFSTAAGLPPRLTVLDEVASQLASEHRWDRFVDRLHSEDELGELLTRSAALGIALSPTKPRQASIKAVAASFNQNWDRLDSTAFRQPDPLAPMDFSAFDSAVIELENSVGLCTDNEDKLFQRLETRFLPTMRAITKTQDPHRKLSLIAPYGKSDKSWKAGGVGSKSNWDGDVVAIRQLVADVMEAAEEVVDQVSDGAIGMLAHLTAVEVLSGARSRQTSGGLEFHDLLVLARGVLRSSSEARRVLNERYKVILLDEFQDTDPIQIELASLIAATTASVQPENWEDHQVADGRLFFVGDAKQSIYRFRRADIELFLRASEQFSGAGAVPNTAALDSGVTRSSPVRLSTNFRTVAPIIDWVNGLFKVLMPEEIPGAQPRYEPLHAWREADSGQDHRPTILGGIHPDLKVKSGPLRELEAGDVAEIIKEIREAPHLWPIKSSSSTSPASESGSFGALCKPGWKPARLEDITILLPTRTSLPYLRDALDGLDIPYRLVTGTLVYDTQEIRDLLAALRAIDDPSDSLSLVAALRSSLYGCSDVDLFEYRNSGGRWDIRASIPHGLSPDHPVAEAIKHMNSLWRERWWVGPVVMLGRILAERKAYLLACGQDRPAEVWRRLRFLVDQASLYEETIGADIRGFLDWAALQSSDGSRVHEPLLPETDGDAVQISTVHGAKGLEFPITILSGMTAQMSAGGGRGVSVLWNDAGEPEVKIRKGMASAGHEPRASLEAAMDVHEKMRLFYVAATRARDHLIVSAHHKAVKVTKTAEGKGKPRTYAANVFGFAEANPDMVQSRLAGGEAEPVVWSSAETMTTDLAKSPTSQEANRTLRDGDVLPGKAVLPDREILVARSQWQEERRQLLESASVSTALSATSIARSALNHDGSDAGSPDHGLMDDGDRADRDVAEVGDSDNMGTNSSQAVRRKGRAGSAVGRAVHSTLELADLTNPIGVAGLVARQCELELIPELSAEVLALVQSALASEAIGLAKEHHFYKEMYVAAPIGNVMVEGYVDLLIETPDGLVVVDYKTDSAKTEAEIDKKLADYELQGASYALVLEEATGMKVVDCRFVFCGSAQAIERSVSDLETVKRRVREAASAELGV